MIGRESRKREASRRRKSQLQIKNIWQGKEDIEKHRQKYLKTTAETNNWWTLLQTRYILYYLQKTTMSHVVMVIYVEVFPKLYTHS